MEQERVIINVAIVHIEQEQLYRLDPYLCSCQCVTDEDWEVEISCTIEKTAYL